MIKYLLCLTLTFAIFAHDPLPPLEGVNDIQLAKKKDEIICVPLPDGGYLCL